MPQTKRKLRQGVTDSAEDQLEKKLKNDDQSDDNEEERDINNEVTYTEVLEHLYKQRDEEDRPLWKMFEVLPSKEEFPVYYEFIKDPIDLRTIKRKTQSHQYNSIDELEVDILQVFKNAHAFNEPKSQISKDATVLKKAYLTKRIELNKSISSAKVGKWLKYRGIDSKTVFADSEYSDTEEIKMEDGEGSKSKLSDCDNMTHAVSSPVDAKDDGLIDASGGEQNVFTTLYNAVVGYRDPSGRQLSLPFLRLPNKKQNPDYYNLIKKPFSLGKIRSKMKSSNYSDLNILTRDFDLVFENAQAISEDTDSLYSDALFLQKLTFEKKCELEKTTEYIEMRELAPKRGRPRGPKGDDERGRPKVARGDDERGRPKVAKGDSDDMPTTPAVRRRATKQREGVSTPETPDQKLLKPDPKLLKELKKERLLSMYNTVSEYKDSDGRSMSSMFLELPDQEEYPDYYKVIPHPIDMESIYEKIEANVYVTEDEFVHEFEILFQNARHYNEEGSEIYEDSVILEKALKKKRRYLNHMSDGKSPAKNQQGSPSSIRKSCTPNQFSNSCQELLHHIQGYVDGTGRMLSAIFERLPSRAEYPDYYVLIKRPIDLAYISSRVLKYPSIDDLEQDLLLLFNNACLYNEPDSQIYKDALTLLRIMIQKKDDLVPETENTLPDVPSLVQNLMMKLFTNVMDHRDEEGRCYSDSLLEVTVIDIRDVAEEKKRKPITLPIIGQLLKLGFYKRLDILQEDVFLVLKEARKIANTDSEMYEDACELHTYFILGRDCLTKDGVRMISPALNITGKVVQQEIDHERKEKHITESEGKVESVEDPKSKGRFRGAITFEVRPEEKDLTYSTSINHGGVMYQVGDFAYVKPEQPNCPANIISIEKVWTQKDGLQGILGIWYYRPAATFHLASRKFMERELFRQESTHSSFIMISGVSGKCYVMNVKDYGKFKPSGFRDEDIYVCESRYNANTKSFKKIKTNLRPTAVHVKMVTREIPLQVKRVSSIFATPSQQEDSKKDILGDKGVELTSTIGYEVPLDKSCEMDVQNLEKGCIYFEKYNAGGNVWKVGDCVYVKSDEDYHLLSKIDRLWTDTNGTAYFQGNWFILPEDTKHLPTQFFMEQECFESNIEDTSLVSMIVGKCAILNQRDYQLSRPTEISEEHVYVCSAQYNEDELKFRKNMKGIKRLSVCEQIRDDEYWIFKKPYQSKRRPSLWLTSTDNKVEVKDEENPVDDDIDKVGFALMKKEFAANLMKENPEIPLEEIASKTEEKWAMLTEEEKEEYKSRGKKQGLGDEYIFIFQCFWGTCEYQFQDLQDLKVHVMEGAHLGEGTAIHSCEWRSCPKIEEGSKPFPTHSRLVRHIREIHFKNAGKKILANQKSKFYFPRHQACEEMFKQNSESSDRPSSRDSSTASSLSPSGQVKNNKPPPFSPGMMSTAPNGHIFPNPIHIQAGMFPPYRMNNQPTPQAVMQQQIMQQQQMMIQARGQMMSNGPQQRPQMPQMPPQQHPQMPPQQHPQLPPQHPQHPQQHPHPQQQPPGVPLLSIDQQQMLIQQVKMQQQQIQKLQQQVQQLVVQQQQKAALEEQQEQQSPIFVSPPANNIKLRHSEAYLRYIEGLRDNKTSLSSWSEMADSPHSRVTNPLPTDWVGDKHGYDTATDALWALRDHMLRDAVSISKVL